MPTLIDVCRQGYIRGTCGRLKGGGLPRVVGTGTPSTTMPLPRGTQENDGIHGKDCQKTEWAQDATVGRGLRWPLSAARKSELLVHATTAWKQAGSPSGGSPTTA